MSFRECELKVVAGVERRKDELIALASDLIDFDTTARTPGDPPRQDAALQDYLADRLRRVGATVDLWEPEPEELAGMRHVPPGLTFEGRPQLVARFAGSGGGPSLLLNGHIDVVPSEPRDRWATDPNKAEERNGLLYGRGSCDMKGGIAAMILAAETLAQENIQLAGDLLVNTVTDEESSGAGGIAAVAHGVRADAGIIPEPTGFDAWIACRGAMTATITVPGRPGHAEITQPHWREGGAVNAIEKSSLLLDALRRLRDDWRGRSDCQHPCLSAGGLVPTLISGGEWLVTYPASCRLDVAVTYVPNQADAEGWGTLVEQEISEWIHAAARSDPWFVEKPPTIDFTGDVPPAELSPQERIVDVVLGASESVGREAGRAGLDSWFDGATFTRFGSTPTVGFGPAGLAAGGQVVAHAIDEHVPVEDLVACAKALALAALRFCGPSL